MKIEKIKKMWAAAFLAAAVGTAGLSACGGQPAAESDQAEAGSETAGEEKTQTGAESEAAGAESAQAGAESETAGTESAQTGAGESPSPADGQTRQTPSLKDGVYHIQVDSSSSKFRITDCLLTVKDGTRTAVMTMGGTGYLKVFMGTGEEAEKAPEEAFIPFTEQADGTHAFQVPVEALDQEIPCSAFSKRREKWYDRTLVFRSDSLPAEAFEDGSFATAESLGLEDGSYQVDVTLEGGSGRTFVESPAALRVEKGLAWATVVWSSSNYDYMIVDGERFDPVEGEETSTFEIPVAAFDKKLEVKADTVAMSVPHEISYTLTFDSDTVEAAP